MLAQWCRLKLFIFTKHQIFNCISEFFCPLVQSCMRSLITASFSLWGRTIIKSWATKVPFFLPTIALERCGIEWKSSLQCFCCPLVWASSCCCLQIILLLPLFLLILSEGNMMLYYELNREYMVFLIHVRDDDGGEMINKKAG